MKRINWMLHRAEKAPAAGNDILSKRFGGSMEGYTYYFTYQLKHKAKIDDLKKFCPNRDSLHSKKRASDIRHWRKEIKNDVKFFGIVKQPPFCSSPFRLRKGVPPCCFYSAKC